MDITCLECGNVLDDPTVACDKCGATPHVVVLGKQSYFPIGAVTANLEKNDSRAFDYRLGEVWDLKNEVTSEFITRIEKKFSRKNKFHNFLDSDHNPSSIPTILKKYINKNNEFIDLSREGANKQVISSQADSLIKISRIWADFFPANTSNQPI
ncbi:hypothetical protein [Escherichia coli]|uniref:hypothetical protein n=1 Tax=Escherichia coli TaxID=562 RepID=UPI003DA6F86A